MVKHYKHTANADICKKLGISLGVMHRIKRELGLKKTPQFMRKCAIEASMRAKVVNKANNWPPKGYVIPESEKYRFKPGKGIFDRMTKEQWLKAKAKAEESFRKRIASERRRILFGLDQKTKLRIGAQTHAKTNYRYNMKKKGYLVTLEYNVFYYPNENMRCPKAEMNASRHGIKIRPLSEYQS